MSNLAVWRKKRGLSQRALAQAAKISYVTIARLETERFDPRLSTLRQLAIALDVPVTGLLGERKGGEFMKPRLKSYADLERAVEMVRVGRVRGAENVVRIIMRCFAKQMLAFKTKKGKRYSPKFKNARGCAMEVVRNIYRFHHLR